VSASNLFSTHHAIDLKIGSLIKRKPVAVTASDSLKAAVELMAKENLDVLPVVSSTSDKVTGILSYQNILSAYRHQIVEQEEKVIPISIKRRTLKILLHGKKRLTSLKEKPMA
jgi:chloride channel protein, CIC family